MKLKPITLHKANAFVKEHHRHHPMARGCLFCISVVDESGAVLGVAIVGRPSARLLDDGESAEVTRLCVLDGVKNACSKLYSASARACREIGYKTIYTYIFAEESGVSLVASGWTLDGNTKGGEWSRESRKRTTLNTEPKKRYSKVL